MQPVDQARNDRVDSDALSRTRGACNEYVG